MAPVNRPNKDGEPSTEGEEGTSMIKENASQPHTPSTQSETSVSQRLEGVRKAARENKETKLEQPTRLRILRGGSPRSTNCL